MSNILEYKCAAVSGSVEKINVVTNGDFGTMKVTYKDSDTAYEYVNIEMDKLVDLERCYRKLTTKMPEGTDKSQYNSLWSIGKFINRNIANEKKYKKDADVK